MKCSKKLIIVCFFSITNFTKFRASNAKKLIKTGIFQCTYIFVTELINPDGISFNPIVLHSTSSTDTLQPADTVINDNTIQGIIPLTQTDITETTITLSKFYSSSTGNFNGNGRYK